MPTCPRSDSTTAFNAWLDADDLRRLLADAMTRMPELHDWLEAQRAAGADDPAELLGVVDAALTPTRRFHDYRQANGYADAGRDVVELLAVRARSASPQLIPVIERAITLTTRAILKSDDSSGLQGDQVSTLLAAHAEAVRTSSPSLTHAQQKRLVTWIVKYRYGGKQDVFDPDIVAYAPGLSEASIAAYRAAIDNTELGRYGTYPRERLAVLDRDRGAIIAAHGGEPGNALVAERIVDDLTEARLHEDAVRYAQIGMDLDARGWNQKLVDVVVDDAITADDPQRAVSVRREWFSRFPTSTAFARLRQTAEQLGTWERERPAAESRLAGRDQRAFVRYLLDEDRADDAWQFATDHSGEMMDAATWLTLCQQRARTHPAETIPFYRMIILDTLETTDKQNYRSAAKILTTLKSVAESAGPAHDAEFAEFLERVVEQNRRRPTCLAAFARAGLIARR